MKNLLQLLGWAPHIKEAWSSSGKKEYTWKSNRNQFYLIGLIVLILTGGYWYVGELQTKLEKMEAEKSSFVETKRKLELDVSRHQMLYNNLIKENEGLENIMERQNTVVLELTKQNGDLKSQVKGLEIEKSNVERLLIAQTNLGKDLTNRLETIVSNFNQIKEERKRKNSKLRSAYNRLTN